ncbi:uncharacterized protein DSM5745_00488 [Aspergillus mulundensis]|uniref:Rhodopsin domain-containing protein n=1 Tax=Aspergillus mulundensis TaxID=1810919 RepID=A0A3D8T3N6_9EURO|nr:Uncharacterized protein DSM5745_00488 [Aspergillus mulundensis]RDW93166.1 Uncharacterized protein DSM5745_00488 [Aspergillus mulundensis]
MTVSFSHRTYAREEQATSYLSSRGTQGLVISVVFTSLGAFLVLARVYTRTKLIKRMEANDWMIVIAMILSFVFMSFFIVESLNGMGMHLVDIPKPILLEQMKAFWISIPFYNAALLCAKASILMQYFRVFPSKRMRHICWFMIGILATYGTWAVFSGFLNCIPVARFWDPTVPGSCISSKGLWFSNASMHIATDLAILVIPIPALAKLELPRKQKVALISIFAVGGFVCITSICRLISLKKISDSSDPTYDNVGAATWSAVECNVGIICACLPTLRPLISRMIPRLLSSDHNPRSRSRAKSKRLSRSLAHTHEIHPPAYWGIAGMGVSTTITTHIDDLEYGTCEGDADRYRLLAMNYGAGVAAAGESARARVYVGDDRDEDEGRDSEGAVRGGSKDGEEREGGRIGTCENEGIVVRTQVRTH